jgi:hypothetical protein
MPPKKMKGTHKMPDGTIMSGTKHSKSSKPVKTGEVELDGEKVKFKEGALRTMLKVPKSHKFTKTELNKLKKVKTGEKFSFLGKEFKKTALMAKRINFALVLMK